MQKVQAGPLVATHTVTITTSGIVDGATTVCSGANGSVELKNTTASVVRWESSTDDGANWISISSTDKKLNYNNLNVTTIYRAVVTGNGCVEAISASAKVTIVPRPVVADQVYELCQSGNVSFNPNYVPNGTTYTWATPVVNSGSITGQTSGANASEVNQTLTNTSATIATVVYTVTPRYQNCDGQPFKITVNIAPKLTTTAVNPVSICSGNTFTVSPVSNVGGTKFTWTANLISGSASGFGTEATPASIISQTITNTGTNNAVVEYTATPIYGTCVGANFKFTVTVTPAIANNTIAASQTICAGKKPNQLIGSSPTGGNNSFTYEWEQSTNGTSWIPATGTNDGINYTPSILTETTQYRRIVKSNNCAVSTSTPAIITVNQLPVVSPILNQGNLCVGEARQLTNATPDGIWSSSAPAFVTVSADGLITALAAGNATISYTTKPNVDGCTNSVSFNVAVTALPIVSSITNTGDVCIGSTRQLSNATEGGTWSSSNPAIATVSNSGLVTGLTAGSTVISYKTGVNNNGCANSASYTLTVNSTPQGFNDVVNTLTCTNSTFNYNLQNNVNNLELGGNGISSDFSWTISANPNVLGATASNGKNIAQTLINTSNIAQQIVYTVTPKSTVAGSCDGKVFTVTVNVPVCSSVSVAKNADVTSVANAGDVINYTIVVTNTGNAKQNSVAVSDPFVTLSAAVKTNGNNDATLDKGEVWTYTGVYTVKQADLDNNGKPTLNSGLINNTATFSSTEITTQTASNKVAIVTSGKLQLVKTGILSANGDEITYSFLVKNTGNVTINNLKLSDNKITGNITLAKTTLLPNETTTASATYQITTAEKLSGTVTNTATVKGNNQQGAEVTAISGSTTNNTDPTVIKTGVYPLNDEGTVNAVTGGIAVENILTNDKLNGNQATLINVKVTQISSTNPNVSLNASGQVVVLANTQVGVYTLTYEVEDKANNNNKKKAVVTVNVISGNIVANNDNGTANSVTGDVAVADVLANDTFNNGTKATLATVTLAEISNNSNGAVKLNADGSVSVSAGTKAGVYTIEYQITDKLDPGKKSTAKVEVVVSSGNIVANNDNGTANSVTGGVAVADVLANDTFNNGTKATLSNVTLAEISNNSNGAVKLNADGSVSVLAGTKAGVYTIEYQIIDKQDASKKSVAKVEVVVASGSVVANNDNGTANAVTGGVAVADVLSNDTFNGGTKATLATVTLAEISNNSNGAVTLNADGSVSVSAGTKAGVYTIEYQITDKLDPSKKSTAKVEVIVSAGNIVANNDNGTANSVRGGVAVADVLANDTFNNGTKATLVTVTLAEISNNSNGAIKLNADGSVSVLAGTKAGVYTIEYQITDKLDTSKKSTAKVEVVVSSGNIVANNDNGTANSVMGGVAVADVLANDTFNNGTKATLATVTLAEISNNSNGAVKLNADGSVSVLAGTKAGVYTIEYQITDKLDPGKKSTAKVEVIVSSGNIVAKDDNGTIDGFVGGVAVQNILNNDTYNNGATATLLNVTIAQASTTNNNINIDPLTGKVNVLAGTLPGAYTIEYQITDKQDDSKKSTAKVTVVIQNWITDLVVTKTANKTAVEPNENISYTITVKNNGPATILANQALGLTESLPQGLTNVTYQTSGGVYNASNNTFTAAAAVSVGQEVTLTVNGNVEANYAQANLINSVTATAATGNTDPNSANNTSSITTDIVTGKMTLVKTGALSADGNSIVYTFTINNTGSVALNNINLVDAKINLDKIIAGPIAPGASITATETYVVTQSDKDAGKVSNTATATAKTPAGNTVTSNSGNGVNNTDPTVTVLPGKPGLSFTKIASGTIPSTVGAVLNYNLVVTNTGNVTLSNIVVTDNNANVVNGTIATLVPNQSVTISATHVLTQSDVNAGKVTNQANVSAKDKDGKTIAKVSDDPSTTIADDATVTVIAQVATVKFTKTVNNTGAKRGDVLNYTLLAK
ncbi:MAG: DUF11 domain-containing protein, partial [Sphingobacteriaceae bacterium]